MGLTRRDKRRRIPREKKTIRKGYRRHKRVGGKRKTTIRKQRRGNIRKRRTLHKGGVDSPIVDYSKNPPLSGSLDSMWELSPGAAEEKTARKAPLSAVTSSPKWRPPAYAMTIESATEEPPLAIQGAAAEEEPQSVRKTTRQDCDFERVEDVSNCPGKDNKKCCIVCGWKQVPKPPGHPRGTWQKRYEPFISKMVFNGYDMIENQELGSGKYGIVTKWTPTSQGVAPDLAVKQALWDDTVDEKKISQILQTMEFDNDPVVPNYTIVNDNDGINSCPYIIMHAQDGTLHDLVTQINPSEFGSWLATQEPAIQLDVLKTAYKETVNNMIELVNHSMYYTDLKLRNVLYQGQGDQQSYTIKTYLADIGGIVYVNSLDSSDKEKERSDILNEFVPGQMVQLNGTLGGETKWWDAIFEKTGKKNGKTVYEYKIQKKSADPWQFYSAKREAFRLRLNGIFSHFPYSAGKKELIKLPYAQMQEGRKNTTVEITPEFLKNYYYQIVVFLVQMFFPHPRENESSELTDPIRPLFKLYYKPGERRMGAESWHRGIKEKEGYWRRNGTEEPYRYPTLDAVNELKRLFHINSQFLNKTELQFRTDEIAGTFPNLLPVIEKFWDPNDATCNIDNPKEIKANVLKNLEQLASAFDSTANDDLVKNAQAAWAW